MEGRVRTVNGTGLYVEERGPVDGPPLLLIHGGPGQSCYDFMHCQGELLGEAVRLIGVDQRGVLRSDPLSEGQEISVALLIEDFEALREQLGLSSWTILGHSAGGAYALDYALSRPDSVDAVIFDCPCWDADLSDRYRLPVAADRLDSLGLHAEADRCRELAGRAGRLEASDETWKALLTLGKHYGELFFTDPAGAAAFDRITAEAGFSDEQWERGGSHLPLLAELYRSRLDDLTGLSQPALLLHGRDDLVIPPGVVARFRTDLPDAEVHTFAASGHFAYHEQPEEYAAVVTAFTRAHG